MNIFNKLALFSVLVMPTVGLQAQTTEWELVWSDEFDYTGVPDPQKWSFDTSGNNWNWGNDEAQNYTTSKDGNAWVEDGKLVIEARKEDYYWAGDGETKNYTSARLITRYKGDWLYGKIEVRAKLPRGVGIWPAIWMMPTDDVYGGWPKSGEIDIMEYVGFDKSNVHANVHHTSTNPDKRSEGQGATKSVYSPYSVYHTYGLIWTEDKMEFQVNGNTYMTYKNEGKGHITWPFDQRFHLILNVAVGGTWGGQQGIDDTIFPQQMLVDYVRVYKAVPVDTSVETVQNKEVPKEVYSLNGTSVSSVNSDGLYLVREGDSFTKRYINK